MSAPIVVCTILITSTNFSAGHRFGIFPAPTWNATVFRTRPWNHFRTLLSRSSSGERIFSHPSTAGQAQNSGDIQIPGGLVNRPLPFPGEVYPLSV